MSAGSAPRGLTGRLIQTWCGEITAYVLHRTESIRFLRQARQFPVASQPRTGMNRNHLGYSCFAPIMLWNDLAMKTAEMILASAQVVGHRTGRMALAGLAPNARDQREFALMGQEKIEASAQSAQAIATHMLSMNQQLGTQAFNNMLRSTAAYLLLASSRTPGQLIARQVALARALGQFVVSIAEVSKSATKLAHRGLKPIHAKATANAKRLGKR
jgi:hypothetical protein